MSLLCEIPFDCSMEILNRAAAYVVSEAGAQDAQKGLRLTRPPPARQAAPFTRQHRR